MRKKIKAILDEYIENRKIIQRIDRDNFKRGDDSHKMIHTGMLAATDDVIAKLKQLLKGK